MSARPAAPVSGVQATNAVAGTVARRGQPAAAAAAIAADAARNPATNAIANTGQRRGLDRRRGQHQRRDHGAAVRLRPFRARQHAARGQPSGLVRRHHDLVQPGAGRVAQRRDARRSTHAMTAIGMPATIHGSFQGTARVFQQSLANAAAADPAALVAVYIVLGILYESYIHPITILSTLPSAGVGAVLALLLFNTEFSIIALIGVILLIGIVKKNAIMMIDFALDAERDAGPVVARGDLPGLPAALPPDHDDDHGGAARRGAAGASASARAGAAPAARHRHRRRADREPGADALHDAGDLSLSRPLPPVVPAAVAGRRGPSVQPAE